MTTKNYYIAAGISCLLVGMIAAALYRGILVVRKPFSSSHFIQDESPIVKKKVMLSFWRREAWASESIELVVHQDQGDMIARIANAWLNLLDEEGILKKRVTIETVLMMPQGQVAFISFDRNPFDKKASTAQKWMFIEGLLKTLRENGIMVQGIFFQAHHQPLQDYHLDFASMWPLRGFLEQ